MEHISLCIPFPSPVLGYAEVRLKHAGFAVTRQINSAATHVLLPVPSLDEEQRIRGGGDMQELLAKLPADAIIIGGNLNHPALNGRKTLDLLQDEGYLWANANITAHCAMKYLWNNLPVTLQNQEVLIIGWGRIGKCLTKLLAALDATVSVSARKQEDRAMIRALGLTAVNCGEESFNPQRYQAVINTVPAPMMKAEDCTDSCCLLDLASRRGIEGNRVIWARGLPGKDAPASSGALIAETVQRLIAGKEFCQ